MENSVYRQHHWIENDAEERVAERQTGGLASLVIILLLIIGGLFLIHQLHMASVIEDCMMAGRPDCDMLVTALH